MDVTDLIGYSCVECGCLSIMIDGEIPAKAAQPGIFGCDCYDYYVPVELEIMGHA